MTQPAATQRPVTQLSGTPLSVTQAVTTRRSVRAFLDTPVPREILDRILDTARYAPSGCNFQPWEAAVLTGAPLRALQEKMATTAPQDPVEYEIMPPDIGPQYMQRLHEVSVHMYGASGIERHDAEKRRAFGMRNTTSFGAPVLLLCTIPRVMGPPQWSDVGMWLQTIMLLVQEAGLDSCPQEFMALHGRLIKQHIGVDDSSHILFCGLAIGYRDNDAPVNNFTRPRIPLESHVGFFGF